MSTNYNSISDGSTVALEPKCLMLGIRVHRSNLFDNPPRYYVLIDHGTSYEWWKLRSVNIDDSDHDGYFPSAEEAFDAYVAWRALITQRSNQCRSIK